MAKTIKSKVDYQVTELVNNLNEAATATSEQKRDFFTTRALYNAKRLSTIVGKAKIGAMAIAMMFTIASCGASTSSENTDSTSATVVVDTVANAPVDTTVSAPAEGSGNAESLQPIK
jgi:hypothetical protein